MRNVETYPAVVTANADPDKRGRIRVACAALLGDEESELPQWVEPVLSWGWFVVPDVGELVDLDVYTASSEDESSGQFSIDNLAPRWRGSRYYGNEEATKPTPIPTEFLTNYGKRRGFATPGGHTFVFDDTDNKRTVALTWKDKDGNASALTCDEKGSWSLTTSAGHLLKLDVDSGSLTLLDVNGNTYETSSSGATLDSGGTIVVNAARVEVGGSGLTEAMLLGMTFLTLFNTHTHPTGVGPSGPPVVPLTPSVLSTKVFVAP